MEGGLANGIRNTPFLRIILPMIAGIVVARSYTLPWGVLCGSLAAAWLLAWAGYRRRESWCYVTLSVFLSAVLLAQLHRTNDPLPKGERLLLTFQVIENPSDRGRWQRTAADVGYFRYEKDEKARWRAARARVLLWVDTCQRVEQGGQYAALAYVNPIDTTRSGYGKLMRTRGFCGKVFVTPGRLLTRSPAQTATPLSWARRVQGGAARLLGRLSLSDDARAVVSAMAVGDKREMSPELRAAYGRVGASHLLAVSGLHMGIVFSLVNVLFYLLPAVRRGHIAKNVAAVAAIWLYAAAAGLSPSVIRAAFMFSGIQVALAATRYRNPVNTMLATAAVMLAIDPNYLFDISFQLSFLAVLAIFVAFGPLYRRLRTRCGPLNLLISVVIIGVVATMGTAPPVGWEFGRFPLVGMLINPAVVLTAHLIVLLAVGWMIVPFPVLAGLFSAGLEGCAWLQNAVVKWCAELPWAAFDVRIPLWFVAGYYLVYLLFAVWWYGRDDRKFSLEYDA